jgi:hypothetical protein
MSPTKTNNNTLCGGIAGHAASGTIRDAACTDDFRVIARGTAVIGCALCLLVLNADTLWPHLFAP